jgi:hypothetical protein
MGKDGRSGGRGVGLETGGGGASEEVVIVAEYELLIREGSDMRLS